MTESLGDNSGMSAGFERKRRSGVPQIMEPHPWQARAPEAGDSAYSIMAQGAAMALAFFGLSIALNGYLIFASRYLPRWLGVLSVAAGLGWLTYVYPPLGNGLFPVVALLGLLGSFATILWLLVRGVDEQGRRSAEVAA